MEVDSLKTVAHKINTVAHQLDALTVDVCAKLVGKPGDRLKTFATENASVKDVMIEAQHLLTKAVGAIKELKAQLDSPCQDPLAGMHVMAVPLRSGCNPFEGMVEAIMGGSAKRKPAKKSKKSKSQKRGPGGKFA